jgi:hypothetical protein
MARVDRAARVAKGQRGAAIDIPRAQADQPLSVIARAAISEIGSPSVVGDAARRKPFYLQKTDRGVEPCGLMHTRCLEPAAVFGRVAPFEALNRPSRVSRRKAS